MAWAHGVDHYENFPVASWLCPPAWRDAVRALYAFARTADDLADEGNASAAQRLAALQALRAAVTALWQDRPVQADAAWQPLWVALDRARRQHALPLQPLLDLLDAFEQDVRWQAAARRWRDEAELLDYCRRSAQPVGRLLLHLARVHDGAAQADSDAICNGLQLINMAQDVGVDLARGRCYLCDTLLRRHGLDPSLPPTTWDDARLAGAVRELAGWGLALLARGWSLPQRLGGRFGWELRLVLEGGWRIGECIWRSGGHTRHQRPRLRTADAARLLWRALWRHRPGVRPLAPSSLHPLLVIETS